MARKRKSLKPRKGVRTRTKERKERIKEADGRHGDKKKKSM